jgi:hypothetical protein
MKHAYHRFFDKDDWNFRGMCYSLKLPFVTGEPGSYRDPDVAWLVPDKLAKLRFETDDAEAVYIVEIPDAVDFREIRSGRWVARDYLGIRHEDFDIYSLTMIAMCRAARDGDLDSLRASVTSECMRARPEQVSKSSRMALKFAIRQGFPDNEACFEELLTHLTKDDVLHMMESFLYVCDLESKDPARWKGFPHKDRGKMLYVPKTVLERFCIADDEVQRCFDALSFIDGAYTMVSLRD